MIQLGPFQPLLVGLSSQMFQRRPFKQTDYRNESAQEQDLAVIDTVSSQGSKSPEIIQETNMSVRVSQYHHRQ